MANNSSNGEEVNEIENLANVFKKGLDNYNGILNSDKPTNSSDMQVGMNNDWHLQLFVSNPISFQMDIKITMKIFEQVTQMVSLADIFSKNEGIEEVATNDIQYFLLPALLGSLTLRLTTGERKDIVEVAEIYFKDFLKRCNEYGLSDYQFRDKEEKTIDKVREPEKTEFQRIEATVNTRANKIQRYG